MISDEHGLHISQRNITASTCGIVPEYAAACRRRICRSHWHFLCMVLIRRSVRELMPVANKYELSDVLQACDVLF